MKPNNPLQVFKAIPRYAGIPLLRMQNKGKARALYFGSKERWSDAIAAYPEHRFTFRSHATTEFEFQTSLAPWALSDRRTIIVSDGPPKPYVDSFTSKHHIELVILNPQNVAQPHTVDPQPIEVKEPVKEPLFPVWFQSSIGMELRQHLTSPKPVLLYFPGNHEDEAAVFEQLTSENYTLALFDLANRPLDTQALYAISRFARQKPDLYRRMLARRLTPLKGKVAGFIFSSDLTPELRLIVETCKTLSIPTVLVAGDPICALTGYCDETSKASTPLCDVVLGWGGAQKNLFLSRDFPQDRYITVGSIRHDECAELRPALSKETFLTLYGLFHDRKTILLTFDTPSDSSKWSHKAVIRALLEFALENDAQLLIRLPASSDDLIHEKLKKDILRHGIGAIDYAECELATATECLAHIDAVVSLDDILLTQASVAGLPAIHIGCRQPLPATVTRIEALSGLAQALTEALTAASPKASVDTWTVEHAGQAKSRTVETLSALFVTKTIELPDILTAAERALRQKNLGVISIPSSQYTLDTTQKYLLPLTRAQAVVDGTDGMDILPQLSAVDVFLQWGIKDLSSKRHQRMAARALGKPVLIAEDGFIRSVDIGLSGTPGLSLILDDRTAYYDASKPSRMELMLQDGSDLTPEQKKRARAAIDKVVAARVSKYNHAPDRPIPIGSPDRPKILLVDQRFGDQAILSGMATEESFDRMILDAITNHPDHDIIVKQHPDAITGGKSCYFSNERLARFNGISDRLFPIAFDINPFVLFDMVEEVYVATSGMGFEALMAGKKVHCYGVPFYSGWGITEDRIAIERRSRRRSIEDIFHIAYIECSRYFDPDKGHKVEVEDIVDYIVKRRIS